MQIKKNYDYYRNLHHLVTSALLHLLTKVSASHRHVPVATRNEILVKYLKPKVNDKTLSNIKKDVKLMLSVARRKGGNLEMKLYELNDEAQRTHLAGAEKLYALLVHLYDSEGLGSRLFNEDETAEPGIIYMLQDHIEHGFDDNNKQIAQVSMLIQLERAPELIEVINQYGWFIAEMKEWNAETHQAHIAVHPNTQTVS